jgi:hypothetical protein
MKGTEGRDSVKRGLVSWWSGVTGSIVDVVGDQGDNKEGDIVGLMFKFAWSDERTIAVNSEFPSVAAVGKEEIQGWKEDNEDEASGDE